ncbi:MAG: hypothetical protein WBF90_35010 [Rivularia sp. (in: cyanobacteria)]
MNCPKCGSTNLKQNWFSSQYECSDCGHVGCDWEKVERQVQLVAARGGFQKIINEILRRL